MKKFRMMVCITSLSILIAASVQPVVFSVGEWEPFTGSSLQGQGIAVEVVTAVCKAADIPMKLNFMPWVRAEKMVADGQAFASFPYAKNKEREALYNFSEPLFYTTTQFACYTKIKDLSSLKISSWADVKPYKVAYLGGSWLENEMKSAGINVIIVADIENAVKMLQAGRVDLIVDEPAVIVAAVKKIFPKEADAFMFINSPLFGPPIPVHLLVSRTYPGAKELLARFNAGLEKIRKNGTLDTFAKKYGIRIKP